MKRNKEEIIIQIGEDRYDGSSPFIIGQKMTDNTENPSCYGSPTASFKPVQQGDFIGDLKKGSPVNHYTIQWTPHGNGTHTETINHIIDNSNNIGDIFPLGFHKAYLVSVSPEKIGEDSVITLDTLKSAIDSSILDKINCLVVRSLPNDNKLGKDWTGSNPTYFESNCGVWMVENNIEHLICDIPSVDKEVDGGLLSMHKSFWAVNDNLRQKATITELAFIDNAIPDGVYCLQFQVMNIALDASPSCPILYPFLVNA